MSRLKRILSGLICVCILASAFSAFAQTQTDSVLTQVVFEGKAYENRTDFTWELHNPIPEGGVKWDGTKEFIAMADFTENQLIDTPSADSYGNQYVKNQIAFTAIDGFDFAYMQQAAADYGFRIVGYLAPTATYVIESVEDRDYYELQSIIHELQSDEKIISNTVLLRYPYEITSDAYYPSDPWGDASWDINRPEGNNWAVEAIKAPDAWEYLSIMQNINVGIIDSMFFAHPDLSFLACYDRANGSTLEDYFDKTKLLGSLHNVDYVDQVYEVLHGTHVAGTFNAVNNNIGITGVYPKGRLIGIGTFFQNRSEKEEEDIVNIIERYFKYSDDSLDKYYLLLMRANDVHVINVSLGFNNPIPQNDYLKKQDEYTNIRGWGVFFERLSRFYDFVLINSAGNKSIDAKGNYWCQLVDNEYFQNRLITVGAFGRIDANKYEFADFSNYGSSVDILAPGVKIYSTFVNPINGDYTY